MCNKSLINVTNKFNLESGGVLLQCEPTVGVTNNEHLGPIFYRLFNTTNSQAINFHKIY